VKKIKQKPGPWHTNVRKNRSFPATRLLYNPKASKLYRQRLHNPHPRDLLVYNKGPDRALHDGVASPSQETFDLLHQETLRLVALVADLLDLTKAKAARMTLRERKFVFQDLLAQALEMFEPQFAAKDIRVKVQSPNGTDVVKADPGKVAQAVRNLL
jgi:signal transduction histidine kinase